MSVIRARVLFLLLGATAASAQTSWQIHTRAAYALERQGLYAAALRESEAALSEAEQFGAADWRLPLSLHNAGAVDRELGRYSEAEHRLRRAVSIWEQYQPTRQAQLAASLQTLASIELELHRPSLAEPLCRHAYELRLAALGPDDPQTAASLHGLASILHQLRRYPEAEELFARAAATFEHSLGAAAPELADVLHNQAMLYRDEHRDTDASPLFERAIAIYEHAAPRHPKLAVMLRNYAELRAAAGDLTDADALFRRSLTICETTLPPGHPQTGIILAAYGKFLDNTGHKKEGRTLTARAQAILANSARANGTAFTIDRTGLAGN